MNAQFQTVTRKPTCGPTHTDEPCMGSGLHGFAEWSSQQCLCQCRASKDGAAGQRQHVGLPSAPEPPRRAQMITIPAPAAPTTLSSAKWAQRRQAPKDPAATAEVTLAIGVVGSCRVLT